MQNFTLPIILLILMLAGMLALASVFVSFRLRPIKQSYLAVAAAVLPAVLMLALFYSLAAHLHHYLGAWPPSIGDRDFPQALRTHEWIAESYFMVLLLFTVFVWPLAYALCAAIRRWRVCLYYLGVYAFSCLVCFGATWFAPSQLWNWWWD